MNVWSEEKENQANVHVFASRCLMLSLLPCSSLVYLDNTAQHCEEMLPDKQKVMIGLLVGYYTPVLLQGKD